MALKRMDNIGIVVDDIDAFLAPPLQGPDMTIESS